MYIPWPHCYCPPQCPWPVPGTPQSPIAARTPGCSCCPCRCRCFSANKRWVNLIFKNCPLLTSFGSCRHSPSTQNLYWWSPSGRSMMVTKSPWLLTIGNAFQPEKVPLMNTCFPPPSHLNTVGNASFFSASSSTGSGFGIRGFDTVPSLIVLARGRDSGINSGSGCGVSKARVFV